MNKKINTIVINALIMAFTVSCGSQNNIVQPYQIPGINSNTSVSTIGNLENPDYNKGWKMSDPRDSIAFQDALIEWDTDKSDKGLTVKEILEAVDSDKSNSVEISELSSQGLSEEASGLVIQRLRDVAAKKNDLAFELVELDKKVFPGGISQISESDIQQAKRNVCYFLSALGGLALNRRGEDILRLIDKNRDGTYTVTFPGIHQPDKRAYTVDFPTDEDLNTLIHRGKNGSAWVAIIINAYNKYAVSGGRPFKHIFAKDFASDYGLTWEGMEVTTAHKSESYLLDFFDSKKLLSRVKEALNDKKIVTVCTFLKGNISNPFFPKKDQIRFSKAHIITLTDVDLEKETVTIRDPYGEYEYYDSNGKIIKIDNTDGYMTLPVSDLKKYFLDISIETDEEGTFRGIKNIFKRFL